MTDNIGNAGGDTWGELVADNKGNLYGTTLGDGTSNYGTVFELISDGKGGFSSPKTIATFTGDDKNVYPDGKLYVDDTGKVFGTTVGNGGSGPVASQGTVFKLTPDGQGNFSKSTVIEFNGNNGSTPDGGLVGDGRGNLYGTTTAGLDSKGTVFQLTPNGLGGTYTQNTLYKFDGTRGSEPEGELTLDPKTGAIYGTTSSGGANGTGTVFKLVSDGNGGVTQTYSSFGANGSGAGAAPNGGLALDGSGNLYGTTEFGGANNTGAVFRISASSIGKEDPATVASFDGAGSGNKTGANPISSVLIDSKGDLYGTTTQGGVGGKGTVFNIPAQGENAGKLTVPTSLNGSQDSAVSGGLYADNSGTIYGMQANGTVFKIGKSESGFVPANNTPCYCTGTRILTVRGEVAVEHLQIGDVVITASGEHRAIKWIGNRGYTGRFANTNPAVLPVCVRAGALADNVPARDLWVSPDHALFLDGVLIPAERLVNGTSIVKAQRIETITYWHVELDSHDVLLAEGAAAESFVDDGGRAIFHNVGSFHALYPNESAWTVAGTYCAPRVVDGYAFDAVRRRLAQRAGLSVTPARVFGELIGHLDLCDGVRVSGWAQDLAYPNGPVCLDILVDGAVVAMAYAETYRADLEAASIGDGCHAFDLELPQPLAADVAHVVSVRRSADGAVLGTLRVEPTIRSARAA